MTKLSNLIGEVITEIVPVSKDKDAILQLIELQDKIGGINSENLSEKTEKVVEDLLK